MYSRLFEESFKVDFASINDWGKEFKIADKLNIRNIEFIIDSYYPEINPLLTNEGIENKVRKRIASKSFFYLYELFLWIIQFYINRLCKIIYSLNFFIHLLKVAKIKY